MSSWQLSPSGALLSLARPGPEPESGSLEAPQDLLVAPRLLVPVVVLEILLGILIGAVADWRILNRFLAKLDD